MLENIKTERNTIMSLGYLVREYSTKSWIDDVNKLLGKGNHTLNTVFNVAILLIEIIQISVLKR